jgi:hypothetical protein
MLSWPGLGLASSGSSAEISWRTRARLESHAPCMSLQGIYAEPLSIQDTPLAYAGIVGIANLFELNPIVGATEGVLESPIASQLTAKSCSLS